MTAATVTVPPPAVDTAELDPLLDDRERGCEMRKRLTPSSPWRTCANPAAWVGSAHCPSGEGVIRVLMCEVCKKRIGDDAPVACGSCGVLVRVTWMEPL